mmetsp:Transcript_10168/g.30547  ORF Transcript_10168/g.30547 Transcript_10168/m.30547 type:complete len:200 (+) Transcript_10168:1032-1631(+)
MAHDNLLRRLVRREVEAHIRDDTNDAGQPASPESHDPFLSDDGYGGMGDTPVLPLPLALLDGEATADHVQWVCGRHANDARHRPRAQPQQRRHLPIAAVLERSVRDRTADLLIAEELHRLVGDNPDAVGEIAAHHARKTFRLCNVLQPLIHAAVPFLIALYLHQDLQPLQGSYRCAGHSARYAASHQRLYDARPCQALL